MEIDDMKPFDPAEVDETLTRVVVHNGKTYLLFPYVNATRNEPEYKSIGMPIAGTAASVQDFHALTALLVDSGRGFLLRIVFNTPWLTRVADENAGAPRAERK
jgi:hypothetical protein